MILLEFKYIGIFSYTLSSSSDAFQIYLTFLMRRKIGITLVTLLMLGTVIIGSGQIVLVRDLLIEAIIS